MSVRVTAVVISHDQPEWLSKTLAALISQTRAVDEIIAVDTSKGQVCAEVFRQFAISPIIKRSDTSFAALVAAGIAQATSIFTTPNLAGDSLAPLNGDLDKKVEGQHTWYWLLHDDSVAEPDALEKMLAAADLSPSVALLGPKQLDAANPKIIVQQGLTLTKLGGIFSIVDDELDQAQHDGADDVLAIGSAGALIRADLYRRLQGFDRHAPNLASDIDFSIRARLSGYRVVVVPSARISHATLSLKGLRPRRWLRAAVPTAMRRAEIHLQLAYLPAALVWFYALALPLNGVVRALVSFATKRPALASGQFAAAIWGFATVGARLMSRRKIALSRTVSLKALWPLRATWSSVRNRNRIRQAHVADDFADQQTAAIAQIAGDSRGRHVANKHFAAAGGWLVFFALLISSWQFWPTNAAATGGSLSAMSDNWLALAGRAGASWQNLGLGFAGPSDPFNWLLAGLGALWFATPSFALALAILLARSVAFAGAWFAFGFTSKRAWVRNALALAYALWPSLLAAQYQVRIGAIFTWMLLPWLVLAVAKLIANSAGTAARGRQSSWVGLSGILFAAVAVASPAVGLIALLAWAVLCLCNLKRLKVLLWVPTLAITLLAPYAWFMAVVLQKSLAIFADPGLPLDSAQNSFVEIFLGSALATETHGQTWLFAWPVCIALLALAALLSSRALVAGALIAFATVAASAGYVFQNIWFASLAVHGSSASLTALAAMALLLAAGLGLELAVSKFKRASSGFVTVATIAAAVASMAFFGISQAPATASNLALSFSDGRSLPALVLAEAEQGSRLRVLEITNRKDDSYSARFISAGGSRLETNSTAYSFALAQNLASSEPFVQANALVANLISANGLKLSEALAKANVGYVLVPTNSALELSASLNSVSELEPIGQTEFGLLWRVRDAQDASRPVDSFMQSWSITKSVQLAAILIFLLLAIPGAPKRRAKNTGAIFDENDEDFSETDFAVADFADTDYSSASSSSRDQDEVEGRN
ncbi:MAG: hypothetical protein RL196_362 [Actinomycetota bacterium]|jgi:GT2 family glycosyltransferase